MDIKALDKRYIVNTYSRYDVELTHGKGAELFDASGKRYIDMGSGIAVNTLGAADDGYVQAVCSQVKALAHCSNYFYTAPQAELAELLCNRTGMSAVFFSNSGAEANECAIKAARKYSRDCGHENRSSILTLKRSFHGRTMATLSATGQSQLHKDFDPFLDGFIHIEPNDISALDKLEDVNGVCAVMIELVQGEGGVNVLKQEYVSALCEFAAKNDMLLIIDEVQTGNGRTGTLYAHTQYGIKPDIVTTAKGLANGLPLGATMFNEKTAGVLGLGSHGSTFGGNPVCAAAALYTLKRIDDKLLEGVKAKANYIKSELENAEGVISVSGLGLMIGVETTKDVKQIIKGLLDRGVIALSAKHKLRLLPPLNIEDELVKEATKLIKLELKN